MSGSSSSDPLYAEYEPVRALYRPEGCVEHATRCWVTVGPPALQQGVCLGCQDQPRTRPLKGMVNGFIHRPPVR